MRLPFVLLAIPLTTCLGLFSGCITGRYHDGSEIPDHLIEKLEPGVTTREEVVEILGPATVYLSPTAVDKILRSLREGEKPQQVRTPYAFGDVLSYQYNRGNFRGLFLILWNFFEIKAKSDHLVIFFDEGGKVLYYGFRRGTDEL